MGRKYGELLAFTAVLMLSTPMAGAQESGEYSDATLAQYAELRDQMTELRASYEAKVEEETDRQKRQTLRRELNEEMMTAIEEAGLSLNQYEAITAGVRGDDALRQKVDRLRDNSL